MTVPPRTLDTFMDDATLLVILSGWASPPSIRTADGRVLERSSVAISSTPGEPTVALVLEAPGEADQPFSVRRRPAEPDPEVDRAVERLRAGLTGSSTPTTPSSRTLQ